MPSLPLLLALLLPQAAEPDLPARTRGYEAERLALERAARSGEPLAASERAQALAQAVAADGELPGWYAAEVADLVRVFELLEELAPEERASASAALSVTPRHHPDPRRTEQALAAAIAELAPLLGEHHELVQRARTWTVVTQAASGRWGLSVETARENLRQAETSGSDLRVVLARGWLARSLDRTASLTPAEEQFGLALETWDELRAAELGVFVEDRLLDVSGLASTLHKVGRVDEAELLYQRCAREARETFGGGHPLYLTSIGGLGQVAERRAEFGRAIDLHELSMAGRLANLPPGHEGLGYGWLSLGAMYLYAGRLAEAEDALERAGAVFEALGRHRERVTLTKVRLVELAMQQQDPELLLERAAPLAAEAEQTLAGRPLEHSILLFDLMRYMAWAGDMETAAALGARAREVRRDIDLEDLVWLTRVALQEGVDAEAAGDWEGAREAYLALVPDVEQSEPPGHPIRTNLFALLGRAHFVLGDLDQAHDVFRRAVDEFERGRASIDDAVGRAEAAPNPYPDLAALEIERGQAAAAWEALEASRARSLVELLDAPSEDPTRVELERELASIEAQVEALGSDPPPEVQERDSLARQLAVRRLHLRSRIAIRSARQPLPLDRIRASLAPDEACLGWFEVTYGPNRDTYAWVLRRDDGPFWLRVDPGSGPALSERLEELAAELTREARSPFGPRPESIADRARRVARMLIDPMVDRGWLEGARHLTVIAGEFGGTPLEALLLDDDWLGADRTVSYAPSGTIHSLLGERPRPERRADAALVLGDPPFRPEHADASPLERAGPQVALRLRGARVLADLDRLPHTRDEARAVADLFKSSRLLTGRDASEAELERLVRGGELGSFSVVHLASHALVDRHALSRSGVVLSQLDLPDRYEAALSGEVVPDGFLSAREVATRWELDAELVTLSACRTALGQRVTGEGYLGLATAFLQAGARSLLVSLWDVDDEATMRFMRSFYEHWRGGDLGPRPKAEALRRARRDLREYSPDGETRPYAHPSFWSAFVLIGDPR